MQKCVASAKASCRREFRAGDHSTIGGSSETDENELAVMPSGPSLVATVTMVTPVPKQPKARRNSAR